MRFKLDWCELSVFEVDGVSADQIDDLPDYDKEQIKLISNKSKSQERASSRLALRELIGKSQRVTYNENGAPTVEGKHISISHTRMVATAICSDVPCGVDVEILTRDAARIKERFMHPDELDFDSLFVWCAKEAVFKAMRRSGVDFKRDIRVLSNSEASGFEVDFRLERIEYKNHIIVCATQKE